ncbi:Fic family protein [Candidatus Kaiserbacteria bacterium]|nr:Fic family protein [Candidatus Kaiserbacteria bacterium]
MGLDTDYSAESLANLFDIAPAPATLRRDMQKLELHGYVTRRGEKRGRKYAKTELGALLSPLDAHAYFLKETDVRRGLKTYRHGLWNAVPESLFTTGERAAFAAATDIYHARSRDISEVVRAKELERFVIELSWKSSRIEGNTYTLLDTERLLREGVEAPGHGKGEAMMILNHKKAFQYILESKNKREFVNKHFVEDVHGILVENLGVSRGFRKGVVGVTGSSYRPLDIPAQLEEETGVLCQAAAQIKDAYSQALLMLVGISYIQPFEDGNKRTARLIANAVLIAHEKAPLSYRSVDETLYRESMLTFYEQLSIVPMKKIFSDQYLFACEQYLKSS